MSDLIDRKAILKKIENIRNGVQMMDDTHRASIVMTGMHLCEEAVRNQPSAEPSVSDCWGCKCPKMERLKEQKTFSEMVRLHDAKRTTEQTTEQI